MLLTIAAMGAALAGAPLPEGRPGYPVPLTIQTEAPGAHVGIRFRDLKGASAYVECIAPCVLQIPRGSPMLQQVTGPNGERMRLVPVPAWKTNFVGRASFAEPTVTAYILR